jgi:hypothetical protein
MSPKLEILQTDTMSWTSSHLKWLVDTGERVETADGRSVEIWEFRHEKDTAILAAWAKHFRNHYCLDIDIDSLRTGYGYSRSEYLNQIKFPDPILAPGPSIRAGDFGEILVADFVEYVLHYWVPRTRYSDKTVRNESIKGCDIVGFKFRRDGSEDKADSIAIFEAKTQFSGTVPNPRLQDAIDGSAKDELRRGESLNAIKQRLLDKQKPEEAKRIDMFQNPVDKPYKEIYGAVALLSTGVFDIKTISEASGASHPHPSYLSLLVIRGEDMMAVVHELYKRAADEA